MPISAVTQLPGLLAVIWASRRKAIMDTLQIILPGGALFVLLVECTVVEGSNAASHDTANRTSEARTQTGHRRTGELFGQSSGEASYRYTDYAARKA